ncbi:hypothetical protein CDD80_7443 [Ophiocordyceps camponoti-rufipedis]|uniref:Uncharacterized protein n=1 Tax=Ophiocordyceps camponoti-rufipedis TaxID=2004952 RepID=A0A2C5YG90_9HYPO|nr:hypothetical protein CDD80_7443 [Ophiocordyceps camponoti-rufipedis]
MQKGLWATADDQKHDDWRTQGIQRRSDTVLNPNNHVSPHVPPLASAHAAVRKHLGRRGASRPALTMSPHEWVYVLVFAPLDHLARRFMNRITSSANENLRYRNETEDLRRLLNWNHDQEDSRRFPLHAPGHEKTIDLKTVFGQEPVHLSDLKTIRVFDTPRPRPRLPQEGPTKWNITGNVRVSE